MSSCVHTSPVSLESLSDEVILNIASFLSLTDRLSLAGTSVRFRDICNDKSLVKYLAVSRNWTLDAKTVIEAVHKSSKDIIHLDLAHCYWLTSNAILKCVTKCSSLIKLDLRSCTVTPNALDRILCVAVLLTNLAVTDAGVFIMMHNEDDRGTQGLAIDDVYYMSAKACKTLQRLKEIHLTITCRCTRGFFIARLCRNLTSFSLGGSATDVGFCRCNWPDDVKELHNMQNMTQIQITWEIYCYHRGVRDTLNNLFRIHPLCNPNLPFESIQHVVMESPSSPFMFGSLSVRSRYPKEFDVELESLENLRSFHASDIGYMYPEMYWASIFEQFSAVTSFRTSLEYMYKEAPSGPWVQPFLSLCSHLKHLNLLWSCCHGKIAQGQTRLNMDSLCNAVAKSVGKGLVSLAIPTCFIVEQEVWLQKRTNKSESSGSRCGKVSYDGPQGFGQRQRVGVSTEMSSSSSGSQSLDGTVLGRLEQFVTACPHMEDFELVTRRLSVRSIHIKVANNSTSCKIEHAVKDSDLVCVSKWKHLSSLTLVGLPGIRHGKCLIEITKGCQKLRYLSLAYLGLDAGCVYMLALREALKYAPNLEDLRLEQPNMRVNNPLCRAVEHCHKLARLYIAARKTEFSHNGVLGIFDRCKKLFVFHLITGSSVAACEHLTKKLQGRHKEQRPALNICITTENKMQDMFKKIPLIHWMELTNLRSHICEKPVGWKGLNPH